jgi:hypothetical protein
MKAECRFCRRMIDKRGIDAHIHFKHLQQFLIEFRLKPVVCFFAEKWPPRFEDKQLPASTD